MRIVVGLFLVLAAAPAAAEPVADAIADRLAAVLPAELGVQEVHLPEGLAGASTDKLTVALPAGIGPGRKSVRVRIGRRSTWVPVTFAPLGDALVARRAIGAGEVVTAADFSPTRAAVAPGAPTSVAAVAGGTATRDIAAGAPVGAGAIALPPPTPRGAQVTVIAQRGAVRVSTPGVLTAAARPGQSVGVRLLTTRTAARGVFVAPATVLLGGDP